MTSCSPAPMPDSTWKTSTSQSWTRSGVKDAFVQSYFAQAFVGPTVGVSSVALGWNASDGNAGKEEGNEDGDELHLF